MSLSTAATGQSKKVAFLKELASYVEHPNHKRILDAYKAEEPVQAMEAELSRILMEIVNA